MRSVCLATILLFGWGGCSKETNAVDDGGVGDGGLGDGGLGDSGLGDSSVGDSGLGDGNGGGDANLTNVDLAGPACGTLRALIRDFKISHPDFEVVPADGNAAITGLVNATITPGGQPTLSASPNPAGLITSATTFADWYDDVADVNQRFEIDLPLTETPAGSGNYVYDNAAYFPIDGQGFGNESNSHNYHFTTELHATFEYKGGETFTFRGDDDVWVFINGKLAIDIGGVHVALERSVDLDARAAELGITVGSTYAIDFFQAERHVTGSNFRIETSIACFTVPPIP